MKTIGMLGRGLLSTAVVIFATAMMARAQEVTVNMFDTPATFRPDPIKIKVGQTVKWVNKGDTVHTATDDPSQAPDPSFAALPKGAQAFDSGYMNAGDTWSYTFKVPGVYKYFCLTHETEGMKGEVDVEQ